MNPHTASEHAAAIELQAHAHLLASAYTQEPQDLATARLTLLAEALDLEMKKQRDNQRLVFVSKDFLICLHRYVTYGEADRLDEEICGMLESISYEVKE
jgi:hypothetical protein